MTESESSQAQALESHVEKLAEIAGFGRNQAAILTGQAKLGADGSVMWRGQTIADIAFGVRARTGRRDDRLAALANLGLRPHRMPNRTHCRRMRRCAPRHARLARPGRLRRLRASPRLTADAFRAPPVPAAPSTGSRTRRCTTLGIPVQRCAA